MLVLRDGVGDHDGLEARAVDPEQEDLVDQHSNKMVATTSLSIKLSRRPLKTKLG